MKSSSNYFNVKPLKNPKNAKKHLLKDFISLWQSLNVNFTPMSAETLGINLFQILCDSLWHITSHCKYFSDHGCPIRDLMS